MVRRAQPSRGHRGTGTISGLRHAARETDVGTPGTAGEVFGNGCGEKHWKNIGKHRNNHSMDWFKGKSEPETMGFYHQI